MSTVLIAEERLVRALRALEPRASYAEVMAQETAGFGALVDRRTQSARPGRRVLGAVFRAWAGDRWAESATSSLDWIALERVVGELARRLPEPTNPPPGESSSLRAEYETKSKRSIRDLSPEAVLEWCRTVFQWGMGVPGVEDTSVRVETRSDERLFLNSTGSRCHRRVERVNGGFRVFAKENGKIDYDRWSCGGVGGLEFLDTVSEEAVRSTSESAKALLRAQTPPAGRFDVLLDPSTTGTFAHESFGHGSEADQIVRDRSYLAPLLGEKLGPDELTIVDDGSLPAGFGSLFIDDEGHLAGRTVLVDRGLFTNVLTDRVSAAMLGRKASGNTQRADFLSRPFVRMTNTFVESGDHSFEELVEATKDGVLLETCQSGMEDPLGGKMEFRMHKGRRIENGKLTDILSSVTLSGSVLEFLREIRGIAKSERLEMEPGLCGKGRGDLLMSGTGGPYLLSTAIVGPG